MPTNHSDLGKTALESEPKVVQFFVAPLRPLSPEGLDTRLYVLRRVIENSARHRFYICSLDRRKIVYKGRLRPGQLLLADTLEKRVVPEQEIFDALAAPPYEAWLESGRVKLGELVKAQCAEPRPTETRIELARCQGAFGHTLCERKT